MSPLLALWQFGSAGMLAWGLAAALPVMIHLWSRRHRRQERWAAMAFLIAAVGRHSRTIHLQHWLLLAMRVSILLLFAVALADPRFSVSFQESTDGSGLNHVIFVIDASYSMDYRVGGQSRFELAKRRANEIVTSGGGGDLYSLVRMAHPPELPLEGATAYQPAVLQQIEQLELSHAGADLSATLTAIERAIGAARSSEDSSLHHRVYLITDLQETTWKEASSAACREQLARLASIASLELLDVRQGETSNVAVIDLKIDPPLPAAGSSVQIHAAFQSFALEDRANQRVQITVDGMLAADKRVDCPAGGRTSLSAPYRFASPGEHVVEAHLADDFLPLDNHRWLSVPVRSAVRVLLIGGRPDETRQAALALSPQRSPGTNTIEATEGAESRLLE
jgi:hypothetical protein